MQFVLLALHKGNEMRKEQLRQYAAPLLLATLIDKVTNPAKAAVMWADELVKELYGEKTECNSGS